VTAAILAGPRRKAVAMAAEETQNGQVCTAEGGSCSSASLYDNEEEEICEDKHDQEECLDYARRGECQHNPGWMHPNCRKSCQLCYAKDKNCRDKHTECPTWAHEHLECQANPGYMMSACPYSCLQCWNEEAIQKENLPKAEILQRKKFVQTDWGLWQALGDKHDPNYGKVRDLVQGMEVYMRRMDDSGPGTLCNNQDYSCMQWVARGDCDTNLEFMLEKCALACQMCDQTQLFNICKRKTRQESEPNPMSLRQTYTHLLNQHNATDIVKESLDDDDAAKSSTSISPDEWVLSIAKNKVFERVTFDGIVDVIQKLSWEPASVDNYSDILGTLNRDMLQLKRADVQPKINRTGTTSLCTSTCLSEYPALESLQSSIAQMLNVESKYMQPLEFVHYRKGERFSPHRDYSLHDGWKLSGSRLLTVFVTLKSPEDGGAMGFPDFDWLVADDPEVLVWPNVHSSDPSKPLEKMRSEQLPVVRGDMYGLYVVIRQYPYKDGDPCA
jgi:hypothetical protein